MSATHGMLSLLVPHELRDLIRREAKRRGMAQRDFVAEAVHAYVNGWGEGKDSGAVVDGEGSVADGSS